jgi:hypothetical protein
MRGRYWTLVLLLPLGCGGSTPESSTPQAGTSSESGSRPAGSSLQYESEIGALDERKVQDAFQRVSPKLSACFAQGSQRVAYLSGTVSFQVRVAEDGSARWAYLKDSTLGDHQTEQCMLSALKSTTWPKPVGGEGLASNENISFEPGGDERPPIEWSPEQLGDAYKKVRPALDRCRQSAGTGPVRATLYVETDGKAKAIGASTSDEKGDPAVQCIVDALKDVKFPSPGSYASKVTVDIQ